MAKLKVFTWSDGFHAYTVATSSRAKALGVWGVARDLFKDGEAREITGGADHDAALATPGETVRRGVEVDVGKVSRVARPKAEPSKADKERVAALEGEFAKLRMTYEVAAAELETRRERLDAEAVDLDRDFDERSAAVSKQLEAARRKIGKG